MDSSTKVGILISSVEDAAGFDAAQAHLEALKANTDALNAKTKSLGDSSASSFDKFNSSLGKVGSQMTTVGKSMSTYITLPIVGIAAEAVKMATKFNQSMTYVKTDAGDTTDSIKTLSNEVLNLAKTSQFGPDELANGLYHLASLGLRGADAMNALNTAQKMASVGGADLESTATALGGALVSGISGVQNYTQAAGVLDATVGAGNMRMQDLVNAIGTGVLPVFRNAGLSITDFGASLATLTDNGQDAAAAATHLRMTIALMEAPSQKAQGELEKIGLTQSSLAMDMRTKGLVPALEDLKTHLDDTYGSSAAGQTNIAAALTNMFGGGRSSAAIQTLLDEMTRVQGKYTQIGQQSGEFSTKYAEQQQTASAQFKTAWDGVQADLIQLGDKIMPSVAKAVTEGSNAISGLTHWLGSLSSGQQQFIIDAAGTVAVMGPVLLVFGTLAKSISEIGKLGSTMWVGLFGNDEKEGAISKIGGLLGDIGGGAKTAGSAVGDMASKWGGAISDVASDWSSKISGMASDGASAAGSIAEDAATASKAWIASAADMVKSAATSAASMVVDATKAAGAWIAAAHDSEIGLGGTLIKMAKDSVVAAASMVKDAAITSAAWVKGTATSAAASVKDAAISSAAWVRSAITSSYAWVTQELPKIIASMASTSASAVKEAIISSAAWVKNAAISTAAWVASSAKVIASLAAQTAVTVAQAAIQGAVWIANAVKVGVYAVAIDAAKTQTYLLGSATVAEGALMAGVFAGLVIDIALVAKAIQTVIQTYQTVKQMNSDMAADRASQQAEVPTLEASVYTAKTAQERTAAKNALHAMGVQGYSSGSSGTPAGTFLFGENGPEMATVPGGTQVYPAAQTSRMMNSVNNSSTSISIGTIVLPTASAVQEFFQSIDRDTQLQQMGMSPARGLV